MRSIPTRQVAIRPSPACRGFTLIELLAVMVIIALMAALVIPAVTGITGGSQITQASDMVVGQLVYARQTALSQNRPVEVRFYQFADTNIPGSGISTRAIQLWQVNTDGSKTAVEKVQRFPGAIIISNSSKVTALQNSVTGSNAGIAPSLPSNCTYVTFQFRPDGSTTLSGTSQSFLTIINENDNGKGNPPPNYATIQIEPMTGTVRVYRP